MSEIRPDGGPAFPSTEPPAEVDRSECGPVHRGLSLRDYFAAQALTGIVSNEAFIAFVRGFHKGDAVVNTSLSVRATRSLAAEAYRIADAMLAERAKVDA